MSKFLPSQIVNDLNYVPGTREVNTVTLPTTAGAAQADYVVLYNAAGTSYAMWLDIDADGTAPTGALYVASDNQIEVDIVGGGTAAQNGTLAYTALNGNVTDMTFTDNLDGTITCAISDTGNATDFVPKDEDDSGAGSIGVSAVDGSSKSFPYESPGDSPTARKINPDTVS